MEALQQAGGFNSVTNQLPYNLLWRNIERAIVPACVKAKMGVLCYSPLQQGLLTGKVLSAAQLIPGRRRTRLFASSTVDKARHGGDGVEQELFGCGSGTSVGGGAIGRLRDLCTESGVSMVQMSVAWLLAQKGVHCVIVGASSPKQARSNAELVHVPAGIHT